MVEGLALHDDSNRTTPKGLVRFASDFLEAALVVDREMGKRDVIKVTSTVPANFLTGQAIELSLKSYLLFYGVTLQQLRSRKYGHNLDALLSKANELGLNDLVNFTDKELSQISIINNLYVNKELQYIVTGAKILPIFESLQSAAAKLISLVSVEVGLTPLP